MAAGLQLSWAASHCPAVGEVGAVQFWCRVPPLGSRLKDHPQDQDMLLPQPDIQNPGGSS